ncbi:MAG: hypothetical protein KDL87_11665 [Verrucomicrobiae bacterium]|nr:hypothetical protein [Verrucomicrobiae bacterium]
MEAKGQETFDAFVVLDLDRRLDRPDEEIEAAWQKLSRESHPDAEGGDAEKSADANRARSILLSPAGRLRHWLTLHGVEVPRQNAIDSDLMTRFTEVGAALANADDVLKRRAAANSALGRALLAEPAFAAQQSIQQLLGQLQRERLAVTGQFSTFDAAAHKGEFAAAIAALHRLGFLEKWESQCRERLLAFLTES